MIGGDVAENAERTLFLIGRTIELAREAGVGVAVTAVPHFEQFPPAEGVAPRCSLKAHREIERVAIEAGAVFFDSYAPLEPAIAGSVQTEYYLPADMHFNEAGHELWAAVHIDALLDPGTGLLTTEGYGR